MGVAPSVIIAAILIVLVFAWPRFRVLVLRPSRIITSFCVLGVTYVAAAFLPTLAPERTDNVRAESVVSSLSSSGSIEGLTLSDSSEKLSPTELAGRVLSVVENALKKNGGHIDTAFLAFHGVKGDDIASDAVTSRIIRDGSVHSDDLASSIAISRLVATDLHAEKTLRVDNGLELVSSSAPSTPEDHLYNRNGTLYWSGIPIGGSALASWSTAGTDAYRLSGRVGIGTSAPSGSLDVIGDTALRGDVSVEGRLELSGAAYVADLSASGDIVPTADIASDIGSLSHRFNNIYAANIITDAISTAGQAIFTFEPATTSFAASSVLINPTHVISGSSLLGIGVGGSSRFLVTESGHVTAAGNLTLESASRFFYDASTHRLGLGTATPSYLLDVNGAARFASGLITPKISPASDSTSAVQITRADGTTPVLSVDTTNGYVGVGTTSPIDKLDIIAPTYSSGGMRVSGTNGSASPRNRLENDLGYFLDTRVDGSAVAGNFLGVARANAAQIFSSGLLVVGTQNANDFVLSSNNTERMRITSDGNVGIGTTSPAQKLDIASGNIRVGDTTYASQYGILYKGSNRFLHNFNYGLNGNGVTTDGNNLFLGVNAGNFTMGSTATTSGEASRNTGIGYTALSSLTTGYQNNAIGSSALKYNSTGAFNNAMGADALMGNESGSHNTAVGGYSLNQNTTGSYNTAIGFNAGRYQADGLTVLTDPENSVYIGAGVRGYSNGDSNSIVIGYNAIGLGANTVVLGNSDITTTALRGNVGIGTTSPATNYKLDVAGNIIMSDTVNGGLMSFAGKTGTGWSTRFDNTGTNFAITQANTDTRYVNIQSSSSGILGLTVQGNVGIGTTSPTNILSLGNAADRKFWIENSASGTVGRALTVAAGGTITGGTDIAGGNMILQSGLGTGTGASTISFQTGTTLGTGTTLQTMSTKMTILGNGNVGIGTTNPGRLLTVSGDVQAGTFYAAYGAIQVYTHNGLASLYQSSGAALEYWDGSNAIQGLVLKNTGNVGIGTTSPGAKLDVNGTVNANNTISVSSTNAVQSTFNYASNTSYSYPYQSFYRSEGTLASPLAVQSGDYIGATNYYGYNGSSNVAVASFNALASGVNGSYLLGKLQFAVSDGTSAGANFSAFSVTSAASTFNTPANIFTGTGNTSFAGRVGIGTTSPGYALDVASGNIGTTGDLYIKSDTHSIYLGSTSKARVSSTITGDFGFNYNTGATGGLSFYGGGTGLVWGATNVGNTTQSGTLTVSGTGNSSFAGNVGIGTTSPLSKLDVNGGSWTTNGGQLRVSSADTVGAALTLVNTDTGGHNWSFLSTGSAALGGAGLFSFYDQTVGDIAGYRMVINSYGRVGIGTTAPSYLLSLGGTAARTFGMERNSTAGTQGLGLTITSGGAIAGTADLAGGDLTFKSGVSTGTGSSAIHFLTAAAGSTGTTDNAPTEKVTILGNGNVGIGTTSPTSTFDVNNPSGQTTIRIRTYEGVGNNLYLGNGVGSVGTAVVSKNTSSGLFIPLDIDGLRLSLNARGGGNVGIGTTAPAANLQVAQATTGPGTVSVSGTAVTGVGTQFTNTFKAGDTITVTTTSGSETKAITTVTSDTALVTAAFSGTASAGTVYTLVGGSRFAVLGNGRVYINAPFTEGDSLNVGEALSVSYGGNRAKMLPTSFYAAGGYAFQYWNGSSAVDAVRWDDTGKIWFPNGNVGIGTTTPSQKLTVAGNAYITGSIYDSSNSAGTSGYVLTTTGSGTSWQSISAAVGSAAFIRNGNSFGALATLGTNDNNNLAFETENSVKMTLTTGGYLGVGTATPNALLTAQKGNDASTLFLLQRIAGSTGALGVDFDSGVSRMGYQNSFRLMANITNSGDFAYASTTLTALNNGNVGIGTTVPGAKLDIREANAAADYTSLQLGIPGTAGVAGSQSIRLGMYGANYGAGLKAVYNYSATVYTDLRFQTQGVDGYQDRVSILNNGNVGIGTTSPAQKLDIASGNIRVDDTTYASQYGILYKGSNRFLHTFNYGNNGTVTTNGQNLFLGVNAGNFTMGSTATLTYQSSYNVGIGQNTLTLDTTGYSNSAVGVSVLYSNNTGYYNSALGASALFSNTTGYNNSAVGVDAGRYLANGSTGNATGNNSLFLGYDTRAHADGETNQIVIGASVIGLGSNTVVLGNDSITTTALKGNVGIGTTTPNEKLDVYGNIRVLTAGIDQGIFGRSVDASLRFSLTRQSFSGGGSGDFSISAYNGIGLTGGKTTGAEGTTPHVYITNTGNVGIGTTSPQFKLDVYGTIGIGDSSLPNTSKTGYIISRQYDNTQPGFATLNSYSNSENNQLYFGGGSGSYNAATQLLFYTAANNTTLAGTARMVINSDGNVGIGTTSPAALLDVNGNLIFRGSILNASGMTIMGQNNYYPSAGTAGAPTYAFNNNGSTGLFGSNTTNGGFIGFSAMGTEVMRVANNGNVGIGTTSPVLKLEVDAPAGLPATSGTTQTGIFRTRNSAGNGVLDQGQTAANGGSWLQATNAGNLSLNYPIYLNPNGGAVGIGYTEVTGTTGALLINGNVGIGTTSPSTGLELGSTSAGKSQTINATEGPEMAPALEAANWSGSDGWSAEGGVLTRVAGSGATSISPSGTFMVTAGRIYKVVITVSAANGNVYDSIGGTNGKENLTVGTHTQYITAINSNKIYFTTSGASATVTITSLSVKELTPGTGDLNVFGRLTLGGGIYSTGGVGALDINSELGTVGLAGAKASTAGYGLSVNGNITTNSHIYATGFSYNSTSYLYLSEASNAVSVRNNTNQQTLRVYNTYTNSSNYERFAVTGNQGQSVNLVAETAGTGADDLSIVLTPAGAGYTILNGNVGIGTTSPNQLLTLQNANPVIRLQSSGNPSTYYTDIINQYDSAEPFYINNPAAGGKIFGSKGIVSSHDTYMNSYYGLLFSTGATDPTTSSVRMAINQSGNVGIGTTTPAQKLDIASGNIRVDDTTYASQYGILYKGSNRFLHNFNYGNNGTVTTDGYNLFLGVNAGNFTMGNTATQTYHASYNTGIGQSALNSNTTGYSNLAVGLQTLFSNTTGYYNSAMGVYALYNNTTGYYNSAVGVNAGRYLANGSTGNTTGNNSLFLGYDTRAHADGETNQIVIGASVIGLGSNTVVLGNDSITTTALKGNVGIGTTNPGYALDVFGSSSTSGIRTAAGIDFNPVVKPTFSAGNLALTAGGSNLGIGTYYYSVTYLTALGETNTSGAFSITTDASNRKVTVTVPVSSDPRVTGRRIYRTEVGAASYNSKVLTTINNNTTASYVDDIPDGSLTGYTDYFRSNTTSKYIMVNGSSVMSFSPSGEGNLFFGYGTGNATLGLGRNVGIGQGVLRSLTTGTSNMALGVSAFQSLTTGGQNIAVGYAAGNALTTGASNTVVGHDALYGNKTGSSNTAIGAYAMFSYYPGYEYNHTNNTAIGASAMNAIQTGGLNTAIGVKALYANTTGSSNIAIGVNSGRYLADGSTDNETGSSSLFIGNETRANGAGQTNQIVIGDSAIGLGSNTVVLGNSSITTTALRGNVGIGTSSPGAILETKGTTTDNTGYGLKVLSSTGSVNFSVRNDGVVALNGGNPALYTTSIYSTNWSTSDHDTTMSFLHRSFSAVSGVQTQFQIVPTISQSGTAGFSTLRVTPYLQSLGSGTKLLLDVGTNSAANGAGTHTSLFVVSNTGNVGIGNTAPNTKLSVIGTNNVEATGWTAAFVTGSTNNYGVLVGASSGVGALQGYDGSAANLALNPSGGNVGIGTTSPGAKLQIDSTGIVETQNHGGGSTSNIYTSFQVGGSQIGSINTNDWNSISYNTTSDRRLKENIVTTARGLDTLLRIPVRDYSFIKNPNHAVQQGFIAQELNAIYPDAVSTNGDDGTGMLSASASPWSVDYGRLTPLLVRSVQELNGKVESVSTSAVTMSQLSDLSLRTDANATTVGGLRASVDAQLTVIGDSLRTLDAGRVSLDGRLTVLDGRVLSIDASLTGLLSNVSDNENRIVALEGDMAALKDGQLALMDFYSTFELGDVIMRDAEGNVDLLGGALKATVVETGGIVIDVVDPKAATVGTAAILPVVTDADDDGKDDSTGSDGMSAFVSTTAVSDHSLVYITPIGASGIYLDGVKDGEGFSAAVEDRVKDALFFNWLIVEKK